MIKRAWCGDFPSKKLIMIVADGLGFEHIGALPNATDGSGYVPFSVEPYVPPGLDYPESASAASAISTGCPVPARWISQVPGMISPKTIGEIYKSQGKATGAVSTACMVDATVAAMFIHGTERYIYTDIGHRMAHAELDVMMGGLTHTIKPPHGACVVDSRAQTVEESPCTTGPLVGAYGSQESLYALECQYMPYSFDRQGSSQFPTILEMAKRAEFELEKKSKGRGYFLMISSDRIDHAIHTNKPHKLASELAELNDLLGYFRSSYQNDTTILFTSDHATVEGGSAHSNNNVPGFIYSTNAHGGFYFGNNTVPQLSLRKLILPTVKTTCGSSMNGAFVFTHREFDIVAGIISLSVVIAIYALLISIVAKKKSPFINSRQHYYVQVENKYI